MFRKSRNIYEPLAHILDPIAEPVSIADKVLALWQEAAPKYFRSLPRRFSNFNVFFRNTVSLYVWPPEQLKHGEANEENQ